MSQPTRQTGTLRSRERLAQWAGYGIAPLALAATGFGVWLLPRLGWSAVRMGLLLFFLLAFLWLLISVFYPARADRTCPQCGADGLERLDARSLHGLRCRLCGLEDPQASAFLIAESEGAMELAILHERMATKPTAGAGRIPPSLEQSPNTRSCHSPAEFAPRETS